MLEILQFIFSDFHVYIGTLFLVIIISAGLQGLLGK